MGKQGPTPPPTSRPTTKAPTTGTPTNDPSNAPSSTPTFRPTNDPSNAPSSSQPSGTPSSNPSSSQPSGTPSSNPSSTPTPRPTNGPSNAPSNQQTTDTSNTPNTSQKSTVITEDISSTDSTTEHVANCFEDDEETQKAAADLAVDIKNGTYNQTCENIASLLQRAGIVLGSDKILKCVQSMIDSIPSAQDNAETILGICNSTALQIVNTAQPDTSSDSPLSSTTTTSTTTSIDEKTNNTDAVIGPIAGVLVLTALAVLAYKKRNDLSSFFRRKYNQFLGNTTSAPTLTGTTIPTFPSAFTRPKAGNHTYDNTKTTSNPLYATPTALEETDLEEHPYMTPTTLNPEYKPSVNKKSSQQNTSAADNEGYYDTTPTGGEVGDETGQYAEGTNIKDKEGDKESYYATPEEFEGNPLGENEDTYTTVTLDNVMPKKPSGFNDNNRQDDEVTYADISLQTAVNNTERESNTNPVFLDNEITNPENQEGDDGYLKIDPADDTPSTATSQKTTSPLQAKQKTRSDSTGLSL